MTNPVESMVISLGNEPAEVLGFKTEEQIETALIPLMEEVLKNENILKGTYYVGPKNAKKFNWKKTASQIDFLIKNKV